MKLRSYRVHHRYDPERYVDVKCPGYWPMEIRKRAIEDHDVFTYKDYSSLVIKRLG